ncbi:hypothetical protein [Candidatus Aalborgicola defluviihabitans]|uniref:phage tail terminator protein n=1 Tax=Candidatus Aalborgicola defluviihabitans TaxID=3386187 RepID=UPI001DD979EC|nr:hypothetical protein [Burkholderiales bacterium]
MIDNLMMLEQPLMDRLADQLADLSPKVHVLAAADLAGVTEATQVTPAVHLVYQGYRIMESRSDGGAARLEQTWLATVATKNVKNTRSGTAARTDAGLIAARVAAALMGFRPAGGSKPLRLAEGPRAGFSNGYAYLPLAFVAELALSNT